MLSNKIALALQIIQEYCHYITYKTGNSMNGIIHPKVCCQDRSLGPKKYASTKNTRYKKTPPMTNRPIILFCCSSVSYWNRESCRRSFSILSKVSFVEGLDFCKVNMGKMLRITHFSKRNLCHTRNKNTFQSTIVINLIFKFLYAYQVVRKTKTKENPQTTKVLESEKTVL